MAYRPPNSDPKTKLQDLEAIIPVTRQEAHISCVEEVVECTRVGTCKFQ